MTKEHIFDKINLYITQQDIKIQKIENERPWGGFFVIDENDSAKFIDQFFSEVDKREFLSGAKLSPKILLVEPGKKLSWQYHHRRAEFWKLIIGKAAIVRSNTDKEERSDELQIGDIVRLKQGERHRLLGLDEWGIVAEIWMHTDASNPSDEDDIVRIQDDFGR
ncbi:MAG: hypothetical protein ABIO04_02720 [Ferruginibacter sp.]